MPDPSEAAKPHHSAEGSSKLFLTMGVDPDLRIVFEDHHLIVADKPAGQLFHGYTKGLPQPLVDQIKSYIKQNYGKPGNVYLGSVSRLDRPVSGVAIFGKNSDVTASIGRQFEARTVRKVYCAVVAGRMIEPEAVLIDELEPIIDDDAPRERIEAKQRCELSYREEAFDGNYSRLRPSRSKHLHRRTPRRLRRQWRDQRWHTPAIWNCRAQLLALNAAVERDLVT